MKLKLQLLSIFLFTISPFILSQNFYLGVGTESDAVGTSCASCHKTDGIASPKYDEWKQTVHSWAQDSLASNTHFGYTCLQCHNTGWDTSVDNYGADEYVEMDSASTPNYKITNQQGWDKVKNVQCEACHGAMGTKDGYLAESHWDFEGANKLDYSAELCGRCHQGAHHPYYDEWKLSMHAQSAIPAVINNKSCVRCHIAQNFIAYSENPAGYRDTIMVTGDDIKPITCVTCHDPHSNENTAQLRFPVTGQKVICDECHTGEIDKVDVNTTPHHTTSEALSGSKNFGYQYPGQVYSNSGHTYAATERCINCHVNMSPDAQGNPSTGHTFNPRVQACAVCHADYYSVVDTSNHAKMFDYRGVQTTTDSLMNILQAKLDSANYLDSTTMAFKEARYNLLSAQAEGSHGIHNTRLVQKLLRDAITGFKPTGITNEQGLPQTYKLSQNYPNPFNPTTQIEFSIPHTGAVKLIVYDLLGKEVATLVNKQMSAGNYKIQWNAQNFSSGIYLYRLETKNFVQVRKMILLK